MLINFKAFLHIFWARNTKNPYDFCQVGLKWGQCSEVKGLEDSVCWLGAPESVWLFLGSSSRQLFLAVSFNFSATRPNWAIWHEYEPNTCTPNATTHPEPEPSRTCQDLPGLARTCQDFLSEPDVVSCLPGRHVTAWNLRDTFSDNGFLRTLGAFLKFCLRSLLRKLSDLISLRILRQREYRITQSRKKRLLNCYLPGFSDAQGTRREGINSRTTSNLPTRQLDSMSPDQIKISTNSPFCFEGNIIPHHQWRKVEENKQHKMAWSRKKSKLCWSTALRLHNCQNGNIIWSVDFMVICNATSILDVVIYWYKLDSVPVSPSGENIQFTFLLNIQKFYSDWWRSLLKHNTRERTLELLFPFKTRWNWIETYKYFKFTEILSFQTHHFSRSSSFTQERVLVFRLFCSNFGAAPLFDPQRII